MDVGGQAGAVYESYERAEVAAHLGPCANSSNNISSENEIILARKLVSSGMGSFMPESENLRYLYLHPKHISEAANIVDAVGLSCVLEAAWFAVANKVDADRL